jgi:hypothetical protein
VLLGAVLATSVGCPAQRQGKLAGWVTDTDGTALPFVSVTAAGKTVHTDGSGLFTFDSLKPGAELRVTFALEGYADSAGSAKINAGDTATLNATLKRMNDGTTLAHASAGGSASSGGNTITFPTGAINIGGQKAASATVRVTPVGLADGVGAGCAPGELSVVVSGGQTAPLDVFALVHVQATVGGANVDLNEGATANVRFKVAAGSNLQAGDTVPLWYFDASAGAWVQQGTGTAVNVGGVLYIDGVVTHLGWWCFATIGTQPFVVKGKVFDAENQPISGAVIYARGLDYHGISRAVSGDSGAYSIKVLPESQVRLQLVLPGAYYAADSLDVNSGAAGGTLEGQDLSPDFKSTVHGHVTKDDGTTPIANAVVYSSTGGTATTENDGSFCMAAPGSTLVAVYVLGRPPVFVYTPATATCGEGNGAEATISVYYPKNGDRLGFVFSTLRTTDLLLGGQRKDLTSTALFYSGFKGDQFAPYDPDAPLDTCKVYTANPSANFSLAAYFGLLTPSLAFNLFYNLDFGVSETFGLDDGEAPNIAKIGALDAGSPGALTNGTQNVAMKRPLDYYYDFQGDGSLQDLGYALLEPWMGGFFFQQGFAAQGFNNGDTLSFSWPGGVDVGAFTAQGAVPGRLSLTAPTDLSTAFEADALQNGLAVTWNTEGAGSYVSLVLETVVIDNIFGPVHVGAVVCRAADDGSYTIPASALTQMPQLSTQVGRQINYLIAKRVTSAKVSAPLTRDDGQGYVVLNIGTEPVQRWSLDARFK